MALTNFTLPFGGISHHWSATTIGPAPLQQYHASAVNNLLYDPADHQESDDPPEFFKNNPYAPPQNYQYNNNNNNNNNNGRLRNSKSYLPPLPPSSSSSSSSSQSSTQRYNSHHQHQTTDQQQPQQQLGYNSRTRNNNQDHSIQYNHHHLHQQQHQPQQPVPIPKGNYLPVHQEPPLPPPSTQHQDSSNTYSDGDEDTIYNSHHQQQYNPSSSSSPSPISPGAHNNQGQYFNGYNTHTRTYSSHNIAPTPPSTSLLSPNQQLPTYSKNTNNNNNDNIGGRNTKNQNRNNNYNGGSINNSGPNRGDTISGLNNKTNLKGTKSTSSSSSSGSSPTENNDDDSFPERPPGFTRVQAGQGSRTQVHAVLDYDVEEGDEEYYDETDDDGKKSSMPTVTPIQGPIFLKNGTVPVVPLFSYPTVNNGTFVQIPIWWTALSVALGLDIRGDVIRGVPCIKRYHQLFCPTAGNSYPIEKIEKFIDDNKALMRRMYGDFEMTDYGTPLGQSRRRRRRFLDDPDIFMPPGTFPADAFESEPDTEAGETYFGKLRKKRQSSNNRNKNNQKPGSNNRGSGGGGNTGRGSNAPNSSPDGGTGKVDVCESKVEVVTPYWASNSAGKIRAIVNTQHFEQAIHQEMCTKVTTARCGNDCGCEQKYKWHRLLAYDPDNDCKGIFMDWFLFPSCCVCRCSP